MNAIQISHLSKTYRIGKKYSPDDTLIRSVGGWLKNLLDSEEKNYLKALDDISLDIKEGEVTGIIGRNGAGKTTLLKILSKITYPTSGKVVMKGRVAALLEVGTGFHPELTGIENIYLNATLLGMKKKEVDSKLDEIIEFSGVSDFINTPIKKYSSGMKVRLAFSVAAHLQPELLIVDEVLAVGDAAFQQKSLGKIDEVAKNGRTVLLVSHNMASIRNLCKTVALLDGGKLKMYGDTHEVVRAYLDENIISEAVLYGNVLRDKTERHLHEKSPSVFLDEIKITDGAGKPRNEFYSDEEIIIGVQFSLASQVKDLRILYTIADAENNIVMHSQISDSLQFVRENNLLGKGAYHAQCLLPANTFGDNIFYLSAELIHPYNDHLILRRVLQFTIKFKGYNNIQLGSFGNAYLRPQLNWNFSKN